LRPDESLLDESLPDPPLRDEPLFDDALFDALCSSDDESLIPPSCDPVNESSMSSFLSV
jgi:hypothetical protein